MHLTLVEHRPLDVLFRTELRVGQGQRADVAHPALDVRALVAGSEMVKIEDAEEVVYDLDQHAFPKPVA